MPQPYHRFVFDEKKRIFVGRFEDMYRAEGSEAYDSWFQEDQRRLDKQLSYAILDGYAFSRVLDLGCGKGTFTQRLKKVNNEVIGVDVSETAISRVRAKYPDIDLRCMSVEKALETFSGLDLVLTMEILSYLEGWRGVVARISEISEHYFLTLYLPEDPIGFIKSFDDLLSEISRHFVVVDEIYVNREQILPFARSKNAESSAIGGG